MSERAAMSQIRAKFLACAALLAACAIAAGAAADSARELRIEPRAWRIVESESGPVNYYKLVTENGRTFVRSRYVPPLKSALLGWKTPDSERRNIAKLRWSWRARALPRGADECTPGKGDSAAAVYVTWKRGLRYYALKYTWSARGNEGRVCARKRNLFVAQDTIVKETGPSRGAWRSVELDLDAEFRKHFEDGDPKAKVPNFVGIGIMSDGDQTQSESSADFAGFTLVRRR